MPHWLYFFDRVAIVYDIGKHTTILRNFCQINSMCSSIDSFNRRTTTKIQFITDRQGHKMALPILSISNPPATIFTAARHGGMESVPWQPDMVQTSASKISLTTPSLSTM